MNKTKNTFKSSNKTNDIAYYVYTPDMPVRAVVQISHGMVEHIERYEDFASFLCEKGIAVCGNDHVGHGASSASGDWGFFGDGGIATLVSDIDILNGIMKKKYPSVPYILLGHSMGSFIARKYITVYGEHIDGVIISGTSGGNVPLGAGIFLTSLIGALRGKRYRSTMVEKIAMGSYNKRFPNEGKYAWLTRDEKIREAYAADPRCTFSFTVGAYNEMFKLLREISSSDWAQKVPKGLPVFLASGRDDPVGDYGKGFEIVRDFLRDAELCTLKCKLYDNCRHEILNETNRDEVYADFLEFIDEVYESVIEERQMGF